ncbi:MAG: hypothetical protein EA425_00105, partial [Puniceicoccaceae bacterium]
KRVQIVIREEGGRWHGGSGKGMDGADRMDGMDRMDGADGRGCCSRLAGAEQRRAKSQAGSWERSPTARPGTAGQTR